MELAAGEFAVLAGSSASGKTTLLRAACGLVPHFHGGEISGSVRVAGLDALESGPAQLAGGVGYVAQDPEAQVVSTTVAGEIELPLELRGEVPAARARAVEEVALALAIPHLLGRTVDTLSGGELQRVALAAALVTRPRSCSSTSRPRSSTRSRGTSWSGCCGASTRSGGWRCSRPSTAWSAAWLPRTG